MPTFDDEIEVSTESIPEEGEGKLGNLMVLQDEDGNLLDQIIQEKDPINLKNLMNEFNLNQSKKSAARANALGNAFDTLVELLMERAKKTPNNFSNQELATLIKAIQPSMDAAQTKANLINEIPQITYQNTQVNVNIVDTLSRDSRERINDALADILNNLNDPIGEMQEAQYVDDEDENDAERAFEKDPE